MILHSLFFLLTIIPATTLHDASTLESLRDKQRVLLVFTPSRQLPAFVQQSAILSAHRRDLDDRDLVILPQIAAEPAAAQATLRHRFHIAPGDFTVVLIGKDGGEKLRRHSPIPISILNAVIDAMPMRQDEIRNHARIHQ